MFFVISGYLITSILTADSEIGLRSLVHFYERRARRILPALFLVVGACIPLATSWWFMTPPQLEDFAKSALATALYVSNFFFWQDTGYFSEAFEVKPLAHTWSLAVEEQFYLFFPLLLIVWRRLVGQRWLLPAVLACSAVSLGLAEFIPQRGAAFYLMPTRAWELGVGAALSLSIGFLPQPPKGWRGGLLAVSALVVVAASFVFIDSDDRNPGFLTLPVVVAVAGLIWVGRAGGGRCGRCYLHGRS